MNGKPKSKKYTKKRTFKSKASSSKSSRGTGGNTFIPGKCKEIGTRQAVVNRSIDIFPKTWFVRFKYTENSFISATSSLGLSAVQYIYALNNAFDTRWSLGGKQCLYYDQVAPYYERMWVHAAKVKLTFTNPEADGAFVGYRTRASTNAINTAGQNIDYLKQLDMTEMRPLNNTGSQKTVFEFFVKNHKVFGVTTDQYHNFEYSHTNVGNPPAGSLCEPFLITTTVDQTVRYQIDIILYTEMTNRIAVPESL